MRQFYLLSGLLLSFFCCLSQSCSREPKTQTTTDLPASINTIVADPTNQATATTSVGVDSSNTANAIGTNDVAVTTTTATTEQAPITQPEAVKEATTLRQIADKVVKEKKANKKTDIKVAPEKVATTAEKVIMEETPKAVQEQQVKPTEMSVAISDATERATASATPKVSSRASMNFDKTEYSFGVVVTGKVIEHNFEFVNKGTEPLVIYDATSTCGCTIPEYPKEPVMPGQTGSIKVTYDSKGKIGTQDKLITIKTNAGIYTLHLKGAVFTENMMKDDK
jgi:outer membrane biosynthesis protein TonB